MTTAREEPVETVVRNMGIRFLNFRSPRPWRLNMPDGVVVSAPPRFEVHHDAIVCPRDFSERLSGGAFDASGNFIRWTGVERGPAFNNFKVPAFPTQKCDNTYDKAIFGGWFFGHFGHFLVETLGWLWALGLASRDIPVLVYAYAPRRFSAAEKTMLKALKVGDHKLTNIRSVIRVREFLVPEPLIRSRQSVHTHFARFAGRLGARVQEIRAPTLEITSPIYVSRRKLAKSTLAVANEEEVENFFGRLGYTVVYPETLRLPDQIRIFEAAPKVAGVLGSFFHASIVAGSGFERIYLCPEDVKGSFMLTDAVSQGRSAYIRCLNIVGRSGKRPNMEVDLNILEKFRDVLAP